MSRSDSPISARGARGLPFTFNFRAARNGLNFTFTTDWGRLDLLGEAAGYSYEDLLPHPHDVDGLSLPTINLEKSIELKRFAGRPKDNEMIAELEAIRQDKIASAQKKAPGAFLIRALKLLPRWCRLGGYPVPLW